MKSTGAIFTVRVAAFAFVCTTHSISQTPLISDANTKGSVCVLPNSPEPPTRISPGGMYNPKTLTLAIDSQDAIHWPHKTPILIDGLDLEDNHLIVLSSDGKRIMSAHFKFSNTYYHDSHLCAYFDGYQGIQLGNTTDALWCKEKRRTCWPEAPTHGQR